LTLPSILVGLVAAAWLGGWAALGDSFLGLLIGLLAYGWIYAVGMLGAGDVKFLMALGALGGWRYGLDVAVLAFLLGGAFSAALLGLRGKLPGFFRRLYRWGLTRLVRGLEPEPLKIDESQKFPFGVAIAFAAIWSLHGRPLAELGWRLW
jgi:prepilin peptidase CpaA